MKKSVIFSVLILILISGHLKSKDLSFSVDFTSRYIWRGWDILNSNPAVQPSVTYNFGDTGFSINLWGSFALKERDIYKYSDELDLTLSYTFQPTEHIEMTMGFIHYGYYFANNFRFKNNTTQEAYITTTFKTAPLTPYLSIYYDFNTGKGLYIIGGLSHSFRITDQHDLTLQSSIAWNGKHTINKTGFSDFTAGASMDFKIDKVTLTPYIKYSRVFMREINPSENEVWFGGIISF